MKPRANSVNAMQKGLSIVELMISITIGMIIILFVSSLFLSSKRGYQVTEDSARLQQDGRNVMAFLGRNLMQAGFGDPVAFDRKIITNFNGQAFRACDSGFSSYTSTTDLTCGTSGSPAFQVGYKVADTANLNLGTGADCNGQDAGGTAFNRFYLATKSGESTQSLYCLGNGSSTPQPLLKNVEAMTLTYGVDTSATEDLAPNRFVTTAAAAEALSSDFTKVVSVTLCLLIASDGNVTAQAQVYTDCGGVQRTASDRKLRAVISNVFTLRNYAGTSVIGYPANGT